MRIGAWINGIFIGAAVILLAWVAGVVWFVYAWLPGYVAGDVIRIPDFRGMSVSQVRNVAERAGIAIDYENSVDRHDSAVPRGHVISHVPRPRQNVKRTRPVRFTISSGPELVDVPDLTGTTTREARYELEVLGLLLDGQVYAYHEQQRRQAIVATTPSAGQRVPWGKGVDVLISMGPRPVRFQMPRLVGLTLTEAETALRRHRLTVARIEYDLDTRAGAEEVLAQEPQADSVVVTGSRVSLTVNERGMSRSANWALYIVEHTVGGSPERDVQVKIVIHDERGRHVVVNSFQQGGARLSLPWNVVGAGRLSVYEDDMRTPIREELLK